MLVDAVVRERDTSPQAGLSPAVRKRNLRGAFGCTRSFAGLSVLVVDDVMTTGATAEEFARIAQERRRPPRGKSDPCENPTGALSPCA